MDSLYADNKKGVIKSIYDSVQLGAICEILLPVQVKYPVKYQQCSYTGRII